MFYVIFLYFRSANHDATPLPNYSNPNNMTLPTKVSITPASSQLLQRLRGSHAPPKALFVPFDLNLAGIPWLQSEGFPSPVG